MSAIKSAAHRANEKVVLGETTPIRMSVVIGLLGFVGACIWWGATVSAKLDVVIGKVTNVENNHAAVRADVDALKVWKAGIDRSGSPALEDLRKEVYGLREDFRLHSRMNGKP